MFRFSFTDKWKEERFKQNCKAKRPCFKRHAGDSDEDYEYFADIQKYYLYHD